MSSIYDLPRFYDIAYDPLTGPEVAFVQAMLARYSDAKRPRLLEPACGSGRALRRLAAAGYDVAGFDLSQPMLDYGNELLARDAVKADLSCQRLEDFAYDEPFDVAFCFVSTFRLLTTGTDARAHLELIASHLRPGGVYLLGLHLTDYTERTWDHETWTGERDGVSVSCTVSTGPPNRFTRTERVRTKLVARADGPTQPVVHESGWTFRTYDAAQFSSLLASVPALGLVAVHDFDYDPKHTHTLGDERLDVVAVLQRTP